MLKTAELERLARGAEALLSSISFPSPDSVIFPISNITDFLGREISDNELQSVANYLITFIQYMEQRPSILYLMCILDHLDTQTELPSGVAVQ